jgi:hypothetical protein
MAARVSSNVFPLEVSFESELSALVSRAILDAPAANLLFLQLR